MNISRCYKQNDEISIPPSYGAYGIKTDPPNVDDTRKRKMDHDLRICTWNVRTLYREGAVYALPDVLEKYKADIIALQEVRWTGNGITITPSDDELYYSCHNTRHEFGCGFVASRRLKHLVSSFTLVDERLATFRIKAASVSSG